MTIKTKKLAAFLVVMILAVAAVFYYFSNRNNQHEYQGTFVQEEPEYEYASVKKDREEADL